MKKKNQTNTSRLKFKHNKVKMIEYGFMYLGFLAIVISILFNLINN